MELGTIVKGVGGFYTIRLESGQNAVTRPKGSFRSMGVSPIIGDRVRINSETGVIVEILPRENELLRPRVANVTLGVIVASLTEPGISYSLLDKLLIQNSAQGLVSAICFNKTDIAPFSLVEESYSIYKKSGAKLFYTSAATGWGLGSLAYEARGHICLFSGVSGAGKSAIIALLCPGLGIVSGEVSRKIGRGKNTTRHTEIYETAAGGFLVDTPGFSAFDLSLPYDGIWQHYPEFYDHSDCRYTNCLHLQEPGCNVKAAASTGQISPVRYDSYVSIVSALKPG
ncbi:MAG: ribosome small subunit-dependent GTPase A [Eubacteriaceae bacterium]|nr:ribosome small subunit-dependent GTPase A [Eubacteriaceae bacterium]